LIALVASWIRSRLGAQIIVEETSRQRFSMDNSVLGERASFTLDCRPLRDWNEMTARILLKGTDKIESPAIRIDVGTETQLREVLVSGDFGVDEAAQSEVRNDHVIIRLPFISSYSKHKHEAVFYLVADGPLDDLTVTGAGPGWSTVHVDSYDRY